LIGINEQRIFIKENHFDTTHFHPYRSAEVFIGKDRVGIFGQIHPKYAQTTDTKGVVMGEFDFNKIMDVKKSKIKYAAMSKYPSVQRDLAFVVERNVPVQKAVDIIRKQGKVNNEWIIRDIEVFDIYEGEHVKENEKSVALSVTFQSDTHTLKDDEINTVFDKILNMLEKELNAQLRS
jgi:phenylalanyl-tRNA synthetase beta chain